MVVRVGQNHYIQCMYIYMVVRVGQNHNIQCMYKYGGMYIYGG